jgi:putative ABC transport system ATP-binding protein
MRLSAVAESRLEVRGLRHTFNPGTLQEVQALQGVDLVMEPGAFVIVLGTNGSGKSTLLNAIAGTFRVQRGDILLGGERINDWPEYRRARRIGRVFQNPFHGTASDLTVAENLALAATRERRVALSPAFNSARLAEIHEQVQQLDLGLEDRLQTPMGALSGGQRQALTLLMAAMLRPTLLLLDEHTAALDPRSEEQVLRVTQQLVRRHSLTTLMVTHSLAQAVRVGDRIVMLHRGRVASEFTGVKKRLLRVQDLLDRFDQFRADELLDDSAAEMLRRAYV